MCAKPRPSKTFGGRFTTPLRYPGGKGRLGPWIAEVMRYNRISGGWYIEPYAGGAGAALFLLTQGYVDHIVINDADPIVYAFWRAATERNADLLKMIRESPATMDTWLRQREVIAAPGKHNLVEVAFATFFLNRTNRSGILSAGVIGGKAQSGIYKLNARYNVAELIDRIKTIGVYSSRMTVLGIDALDLLTDVAPGFPKECMVYLDPPYYVKGSQLYRNHYAHEDHAAIAERVEEAKFPLIVTYDDCPAVRQLYGSFEATNFELHYSTHSARPLTSEVLFYKNLELPFEPVMTRATHLTQHARTNGAMASQKVLSAW